MEEKRIEAVKAWPEPQSIWDIQVFLGFANFYRWFIKGFSKIAAPFTSILKTIPPTLEARPVRLRAYQNELSNNDGGGIGGGRIDDRLANLLCSTKKMGFGSGFFTSEASLAFTQLRKAFTKAPILYHFNPKCHIRIETNALGYTIGGVLSQLTIKRNLVDKLTHEPNSLNPLSKIG